MLEEFEHPQPLSVWYFELTSLIYHFDGVLWAQLQSNQRLGMVRVAYYCPLLLIPCWLTLDLTLTLYCLGTASSSVRCKAPSSIVNTCSASSGSACKPL